jgi:membrane protein
VPGVIGAPDGKTGTVTARTTREERGGTRAAVPGLAAHAPHRIPPAGWQQVLRRAAQQAGAERVPLMSAGIAFFAVLSIAPVLVTALSVYGAINTPAQAQAQLSEMAADLPPDLRAVIADQLTTITAASTGVLTFRGLTSLLLALWTATTAMSSLVDALTLAYHETETRSLLRRTALSLGFVLGGALLLGAALAGIGIVTRWLAAAPPTVLTLSRVGVWVVLGLVMTTALAVLYRFAPDRKRAGWHWVTWGAALVTITWVLTSIALFAWVQSLGTYSETYGSLAGVAISMFWLWITVLLVVLGAVVNAEAERQTGRDSTVGPEAPLGERGAVVADSAPPYPRHR